MMLVPITIRHLGSERYGLWMTMLSFVALLGLSDLGIGNAVVSRIAKAQAKGDSMAISRDISSASAVFVSAAGLLLTALALVGLAVPWAAVFNIENDEALASETRAAVMVILVIFILKLPVDLVSHARRGRQEGYVNSLVESGSSLARVLLVTVAVWLGAGLPGIVAAASVPLLLGGLVNWGLLTNHDRSFVPRARLIDRSVSRELLRSGGLFLALQIAVLVAFTSDNFVVAQVLGPGAVANYAVPAQLALLGISTIGFLSAPMWPAYADAWARGERVWIAQAARRNIVMVAAVSTCASIGFAVVGRSAIEVWTAGEITPGWPLILGFAGWVLIAPIGNAVSALLNALHVVRFQVVCSSAMAVANIVVSVGLAQRIGVAGPIYGTLITYTVFVVAPYCVYVPRKLRRMAINAH